MGGVQSEPRPGGNEALTDAVSRLLAALLEALGGLAWAQRRLHPSAVTSLIEALAPLEAPLEEAIREVGPLEWPSHVADDGRALIDAGLDALAALQAFRQPAVGPTPIYGLYRALRRSVLAVERLYPLAPLLVPVNRFFLEEPLASSDEAVARLAKASLENEPGVPVGVLDGANDRSHRGGFSLYVPELYDPARSWPLVVALHGGSGHGADFLWTWLREARSRGFLLLSPTSVGDTWSLLQPEIDTASVAGMVEKVAETWCVDPGRVMLTGMSDGGTFTMICGLQESVPFTHLAPISGVLAPLDSNARRRVAEKPVYLVHGGRDWMFPVETARMARAELERCGAALVYREIEDLSHTYPREENGRIVEWLDPSLTLTG